MQGFGVRINTDIQGVLGNINSNKLFHDVLAPSHPCKMRACKPKQPFGLIEKTDAALIALRRASKTPGTNELPYRHNSQRICGSFAYGERPTRPIDNYSLKYSSIQNIQGAETQR